MPTVQESLLVAHLIRHLLLEDVGESPTALLVQHITVVESKVANFEKSHL